MKTAIKKEYKRITASQYEQLQKEWAEHVSPEPPGCGVSWLWFTGIEDEGFVAGMLHDFDWEVKWEARPINDLKFHLRIQNRLFYEPVWCDELGRLTWKLKENPIEIRNARYKSWGFSMIVFNWRPGDSWSGTSPN